VAKLVTEIAAASAEQTQGIDQINSAIAAMDRVTQESAAGAEQIASSAEELRHQAGTLAEVVASLRRVVGGTSQAGEQPPQAEEAEPSPAAGEPPLLEAGPRRGEGKRAQEAEDEDFAEF
jgi:methyl-accepting chemotaxis protein